METKIFEVRDRATMMAVMATHTTVGVREGTREQKLIRRAGFGSGDGLVIVTPLTSAPYKSSYDGYHFGPSRTIGQELIDYIQDNWGALENGELIDVRVILGETTKAAESGL